jgi:hypothetical protein
MYFYILCYYMLKYIIIFVAVFIFSSWWYFYFQSKEVIVEKTLLQIVWEMETERLSLLSSWNLMIASWEDLIKKSREVQVKINEIKCKNPWLGDACVQEYIQE